MKEKIKIIRAPTRKELIKEILVFGKKTKILKMNYSNIGNHRATIIFK